MNTLRHMRLVLWMLGVLALNGPQAQVGNADTDFLYARKLYDDKLYALAAQEFSRFVRNYPSDIRLPDARFYAGMAHFNTGEFDQARREFQYLAVDFPKDKRAPEAWLKVAECYAGLNDFGAAANALSSIAVFYPDAPNAVSAILLSSDYFVKAGDWRNAKDKLLKLIADQPDIPEIHTVRLRLAAILKAENNYAAALNELQSVIDKSKDGDVVAGALFEMARIQEGLGKPDDSKISYERILQKYSKTSMAAGASVALGRFAIRERDYETARKRFEAASSGTGVSQAIRDEARISLGDVAFLMGQYVQAADAYKTLATGSFVEPRTVEANFKWALALERTNLLNAAIDRYLVIVDSAGDRMADSTFVRLAHLKLAQTYGIQKSYRESARHYDSFVKRYADWPKLDRIYMAYATILQDKLGEPAEAARVYERLLKDAPQSRYSDQATFRLAQAYEASGRIQDALDILRRFRSEFPGSEWIPSAEDEMAFVAAYHGGRENSTLENLILLLGSLIEDRPKDEIAFAYARLYFDQLKDYRQAAQLFRNVALQTKNRKLEEEALFFQAKSYEWVWKKDAAHAAYGDSAAVLFKRLTAGARGDEAAMALTDYVLTLETDTLARARRARDEYMAMVDRYPASPYRDRMLMQLGKALFALGEIKPARDETAVPLGRKGSKEVVAKDTVASRRFTSAMDCFLEIKTGFPSGPYVDDAAFYHALGYVHLGIKDKRVTALMGYLSQFPRGKHVAQVKYLLARYKDEQGDYAAANAMYQDLISQYYYCTYADSAAQGIGNTYLLTKQYAKAIEAYQANLAMMQDEYAEVDLFAAGSVLHNPIDYRIALAYEKLGQTSRAIQYYESYLHPDQQGDFALEALKAMAALYEGKQLTEKAVRCLTTIADRYPTTDAGVQALMRVADLRFRGEKFDDAKKAYLKLAERAKDNTTRLIFDSRVIVCTYRLGQINLTTELEKSFSKKYEKDKALKILLSDYSAEFMYELGRYYQYTGKNFDLAFRTYTRLIEEYKTAAVVPEALFEMGVIRYKQGKSKDGYALLQQIPVKYPDSEILPKVYLRMAIEAFQLEQIQTAIDAAKMAVQHPKITTADAKYATDFLIKVYKAAGYYENALLLIQRYLERFPDDEPANLFSKRIDIGVMHKNLKAYDRAVEYFKDLIKTASGEDEAEIQYNIAETYFAKGQFEQALLEYLRIPYLTMGEKFDWSSAARSQAAECYVRLRKYEEAIRLYEEIVKKSGANSEYGLFSKQRILEIRQLMKP